MVNQKYLCAPFPYFGGKSKIAAEVWRRFGDVPNFVEPFFGSGAVLLKRPIEQWSTGRIETVNDADGLLANFWRAVKADPELVASWADQPINECDLHARHAWLVGEKDSLQSRLEGDPDYYDAKIAGWWCWGMCCWIGGEFCSGKGPWVVKEIDGLRQLVRLGDAGRGINRRRVHLGNAGRGIQRRRVHLGDAGRGIQRKRVHLGDAGSGITRQLVRLGDAGRGIYDWMDVLSERLRHVRVCCGDWSRVCGPTPTFHNGLTGVFLDPPYSDGKRDSAIYRKDSMTVAQEVFDWAMENGANPKLRIAVCGYDGEHEFPDTWTVYRWKAHGGYGNLGNRNGKSNRYRETIWFSPHCLKPESTADLLESNQ